MPLVFNADVMALGCSADYKKNRSLDAFDEIFGISAAASEVDVDFGLFLSGGLDSSLITAVTRSIRRKKH